MKTKGKSPSDPTNGGGGQAAGPGPSLSTAEDIAEELRSRIQKSDLLPGEWLREARLCSEFGVGRTVIRRALRIVADDGLIELEENRGARVSETSVEEVFDLYEVRAALYGLAARFACLRASDVAVKDMVVKIDRLLAVADQGAAAEEIMDISEAIFTDMAGSASTDARHMIEAIRRKTRWHFSYVALALNAGGDGPYDCWHQIRAALLERDADRASQGARELIYFMQGAVSQIMLKRGPRFDKS